MFREESMSFSIDQPNIRKIVIGVSLLLVVTGVLLRFNNITKNDFVLYDEGYYLNFNRTIGEIVNSGYVRNPADFFKAFGAYIRSSLGTGKALWFLIVDSRIFFGALESWFFPRLVAAISGSLTLLLVYRFARRFYDSPWTGWLSVALLAILPSHVFYSRIGLQETFSTLLLLAGFYFYLFPRRFGPKTFIAGTFFAAAFFANYRLLILPVLVAFCELWVSFSFKSKPDFRKYVWFVLTFFFFVVMVGSIDQGRNTIVTFAWIFRQAHLAGMHFDPINLFSYPYYIFRLDNGIFALFFFGNIYLLFKRRWLFAFPFLLVCLHMFIFSFAGEKGARYLCVVMPFMVMSVAYLAEFLFREKRNIVFRAGLIICIVGMTGFMGKKALAISRISSDYRTSAEFLAAQNPDIKFMSTQNYVQNLYTADKQNVAACPHGFSSLVMLHNDGFQYLAVGPQAYISWTDKKEKFNPELHGYLEFIVRNLKPVKTFPHFSDVMLERFVFEHNENLLRSIRFLRLSRRRGFGRLRIYDPSPMIPVVLKILAGHEKPGPPISQGRPPPAE